MTCAAWLAPLVLPYLLHKSVPRSGQHTNLPCLLLSAAGAAVAGFWLFMFAGCCHYWDMFWYFLPGMVLYGVDGVYRIHQGLGLSGSSSSSSGGCVQVLEAVASPGGTTCSLLLAAPR